MDPKAGLDALENSKICSPCCMKEVIYKAKEPLLSFSPSCPICLSHSFQCRAVHWFSYRKGLLLPLLADA
jgi:hypothetical protein